jgi:predicted nucleic acid-binding protein
MKPSVYVDTTIPSYYVDEREELRLHIERTRQWWDHERSHYDVYVSDLVLLELQDGSYPRQHEAIGLVASLPRLAPSPDLSDIVEAYLAHRLMPREDLRDALHLAFASYYRVEFLLTWNCQHLANARKQRHIRTVNTLLSLNSPLIVTPLELVLVEPEEET